MALVHCSSSIVVVSTGPATKVKSETNIGDVIAMQLKKPTTLTHIKKEPVSTAFAQDYTTNEMQLIKSPGSFKLKKEKVEQIQKNFYESHSSKLLHQVSRCFAVAQFCINASLLFSID